jgi:hypothetical protein
MKITCLSLPFVSILALSTGFSTFALAQQTAPATYRVVVNRVKLDMLNEWLDLEKKEVVPALKKGGVRTQSAYATFFGNAGEYVVLRPFDKYADFDNPSPLVKALTQPVWDRLQAKLRKCLESQTSYAQTRLVDISNAVTPAPEVIVSVRYRIAAGKMPDFIALVKSDILPLYKKAKVQLIVNQRGPGANVNDVTMSTGYQKYADMDGGTFLTKQLGADGLAKLNEKFAPIRTLVEVIVRHRVDDLSW